MIESLTLTQLLLSTGILVVAYLVRGITGFGSGLISIPLLALMLPLSVVVPMIGLLDYTASATHGVRHREAVKWRDLLPLLPFTLIGVVGALYLFKAVDGDLLRVALGAFIILYATYTLFSTAPPARGSRLWSVPAGGLGGLVGTLFGTGGPFYVIYLGLRGLEKREFRATIATIFLLDGGARLVGYAASGFYTLETLALVLAALPVMGLALFAGGHIHTTIPQTTFQKGIGLLLLGSGIGLIAS